MYNCILTMDSQVIVTLARIQFSIIGHNRNTASSNFNISYVACVCLLLHIALNYDEAIMAQVENIQKEVSRCSNLSCTGIHSSLKLDVIIIHY